MYKTKVVKFVRINAAKTGNESENLRSDSSILRIQNLNLYTFVLFI